MGGRARQKGVGFAELAGATVLRWTHKQRFQRCKGDLCLDHCDAARPDRLTRDAVKRSVLLIALVEKGQNRILCDAGGTLTLSPSLRSNMRGQNDIRQRSQALRHVGLVCKHI
jgi:hypothetical protein